MLASNLTEHLKGYAKSFKHTHWWMFADLLVNNV